MRTVGGHQETRRCHFARAGSRDHLEVGALGRDLEILDAGGHADLHAADIRKAAPQRRADRPVGNDVTESIDAVIRGLQARESEPTGIRDMNGADRSGVARDLVPDPQAFEDSAAGIAESRGALVEARLGRGIRRDTFDEQRPHARAREAERQARAYEAAADDGDVELSKRGPRRCGSGAVRISHGQLAARAISFSMASTSLGTPSVRTWTPVLVTTTSSSMRTPIRWKRFGTPRAPAGM